MSEPKIIIDQLGGNCPVEGDGWINGALFYFRARGEHWSLSIATDASGPDGDTAWVHHEEWPGGKYAAGWMEWDEAKAMIEKGARIYQESAQ